MHEVLKSHTTKHSEAFLRSMYLDRGAMAGIILKWQDQAGGSGQNNLMITIRVIQFVTAAPRLPLLYPLDVMKKRSYISGILSLLLSALAAYTAFSLFRNHSILSFSHLFLVVVGFIGSLTVLLGKIWGKWILIFFYLIQTFEIFAGDVRFSLNVGIGFPIRQFYGGIEEAMKNPHGWGINLLAVGMLILTFMISKKESHNQSVTTPDAARPTS